MTAEQEPRSTGDLKDWRVFTGQDPVTGEDPIERLRKLDIPSWRDFKRKSEQPFVVDDFTVQMVNAAIYLRRPLLVTGKPGTGKSSLARAIARQLKIEPMLKWPITTRSNLQDALYRYDALGRLRDVQAHPDQPSPDSVQAVARYIRLGPLGTALASPDRPRVLLIDEIDKGDIDLPNDLLHVFEEGEFVIPELTRLLQDDGNSEKSKKASQAERSVKVQTDDNTVITIAEGHVQCQFFPIVVMTSNGERDFPPAFLRRCIQLEIKQPDKSELQEIVRRHLGDELYQKAEALIVNYVDVFEKKREAARGDLATDQLLNLVYLMTRDVKLDESARHLLEEKLLARLSTE